MTSTSDLDAKILNFLRQSNAAVAALHISKGIGLTTAKEVNPTLYSLEEQGLIKKLRNESKVLWGLVRSGGATNMQHSSGTETVNPFSYSANHSLMRTDVDDPLTKIPRLANKSNAFDTCDGDIEMEPLQEEEQGKFKPHSVHIKRTLNEREHGLQQDSGGRHNLQEGFSVPRAPHEILKPAGSRLALLANAHYGISEYKSGGFGAPKTSTGQFHMPLERHSFELRRQEQHYSYEDNRSSDLFPDRSSFHGKKSTDGYHYGYHQSEERAATGETFHGANAEVDERIKDRILDFLSQFNRPCSTLEIAKAVNRKTKKEINPILYDMQRQGLITKTSSQPPAWRSAAHTASRVAPLSYHQQTSPRGNFHNAINQEQHGLFRSNPSATDSSARPTPPANQTEGNRMPRQLSWHGTAEESFFVPKESPPVKSQRPIHSHQCEVPKELSRITFAALNKNPVSAINEYAQGNQMPISFELLHEGKGGKNRFLVAVKLNGLMYDAVSAGNMKEARRQAADVALREILKRESATPMESIGTQPNLTHFDQIAALSHQAFVRISSEVQEKFAGRKVIAAIVKKTYDDEMGVVVSFGAGNRCITGDRLNLNGKTVNDSHAEIICRRAFLVYLYSELEIFYANKESIFEEGGIDNKLQVKDGITWHLYISTAPCGDAALFSPRETGSINSNHARDHSPLYTSKQQGLLRTKIEDGEGTIPIDPDDGPQTWDGIVRGKRLRTMSCTDKVCRWNVLGLQGALLSHLVEPIYLDSLTLGDLYEHGHLSRAVCCRLNKVSNIEDELPMPFSLNHPWIGRVSAYDPPRETEKTNNLSINWSLGSSGVELTDGRTGACLTRTDNAPTPSRLCKAELFQCFKRICIKVAHLKQLAEFDTYRETKEKACAFQKAKDVMNNQFRKSKFGSWVKKPRELELFDL